MGWFDSFFHPENAYKEAQNAANKGYGESQSYLQPYMKQGQDQYGKLMSAQNELLNPADLLSKWSNAYQTSPYAQHELSQNMEQGQEAASQMGINGSSGALGNIQQGAGNIVNKDREGFLNRLMQQYMQGIGLGKDIYGTGASAANSMSSNAMSHGNDIASLKYGEESAPGNQFGKVLGLAANMIPGVAATKGVQGWLGSSNKFNPWGDFNANNAS